MAEGGQIAVHEFEGSLIGSIQLELSESVMRAFRDDLLEQIRRTGCRSAVIDVSGLEVMDLHEFDHLRRTFRMAGIMGCRTVLAGMNPGVVAALVQLDADTDGIETALSIEHALELIRAGDEPEEAPDEEELQDAAASPDGEGGGAEPDEAPISTEVRDGA